MTFCQKSVAVSLSIRRQSVLDSCLWQEDTILVVGTVPVARLDLPDDTTTLLQHMLLCPPGKSRFLHNLVYNGITPPLERTETII